MAPWSLRQRRRRFRLCATAVALAAICAGAAYMLGASSGVAKAEGLIDSGYLSEAEAILTAMVEHNPGNQRAAFDLAYVYLLEGRLDEAERQFAELPSSDYRTEGMAAVAHARDGAGARSVLEDAARAIPSAYPRALLASLDLAEGRPDEAVQALRKTEKREFVLAWQWAERQVLLGRALYHLKKFDQAAELLDHVGAMPNSMTMAVSEAVRDQAYQQTDVARTERIHRQIADLAELLRKGTVTSGANGDAWSSRPVTLCLLPPEDGNSLLAREVGLSESLTWMLERRLQGRGPHTLVDREVLEYALTEQSISALLTTGDPRVQLGRVLGARCLIQSKFFSVLGEDLLSLMLIDTETTEQFSGPEVPFERNMSPDEFLDELANKTLGALREAFPLRGKLSHETTGTVLNIGANVGVEAGMTFGLMPAPGVGRLDRGPYALVLDPVATDHAMVSLHGLAADDIPPGGLYARQVLSMEGST